MERIKSNQKLSNSLLVKKKASKTDQANMEV